MMRSAAEKDVTANARAAKMESRVPVAKTVD
jgi:hypothetical protein